MTIGDLDTGRAVVGVLDRGERGATFRKALASISEAEVDAVRAALDERIEGSRIETSAWIPGSDWRGTPWQPIFDAGAKGSFELAALMFGLFVWEAFERHDADWFTTKFSAGARRTVSASSSGPLIRIGGHCLLNPTIAPVASSSRSASRTRALAFTSSRL